MAMDRATWEELLEHAHNLRHATGVHVLVVIGDELARVVPGDG
jgi:hypothetical protein